MRSVAARVLASALLAAPASSLAACGGAVLSGPAGAASHDSPDGAVRGLMDALASGDATSATAWIAPGERSDFSSAIDAAKSLGLTMSFHVQDFSISSVDASGDRASVVYGGEATACITGPGGNTSTDGAGCHPLQSHSGAAESDTMVCVRQGGSWYVSLSNTITG